MGRAWRDEGSVQCVIAADTNAVYERISDVTTTGDRSVECRSCEWLPGAAPGTVGARFRGRDRSGLARWSRVSEVKEAELGRKFSFRTVPERVDPTRADSTTWSYLLVPEGAGTRVTHAYRITKYPARPVKWLYGRLFPHHRDMRQQMTQTLEALRAALEADTSNRSHD